MADKRIEARSAIGICDWPASGTIKQRPALSLPLLSTVDNEPRQ
jgi:hypothetical protein